MSPCRVASSAVVSSLLAAGIILVGCNGCELPDYGPSALTAEELTGEWAIGAYALDDDGCEPRTLQAPYDRIVIEHGGDDGELQLQVCPDGLDSCPDQPPAENTLHWNDELHRAEATHLTAGMVNGPPESRICRLSRVKTLLTPDNSQLEFTRSVYEIELPIEGEESCNAELAEASSAQMPCKNSQSARLVAPDAQDSPLSP